MVRGREYTTGSIEEVASGPRHLATTATFTPREAPDTVLHPDGHGTKPLSKSGIPGCPVPAGVLRGSLRNPCTEMVLGFWVRVRAGFRVGFRDEFMFWQLRPFDGILKYSGTTFSGKKCLSGTSFHAI
jgi:hypothetical protein